MAATTVRGPTTDRPEIDGLFSSAIALAETNQLKTSPGRVCRINIWNVGITATIAVYDALSGTTQQLWGWATADGLGTRELQIPFGTGIRVISAGATPASFTLVWF